MLHRLKQEGPARVLKHLAWLAAHYPSPLIQEKLSYLQKREAHMQYPSYQQAGWPIGSGSVESANKLVVEARLKGAGMRWQRHNVNPMLVLRQAVCNGRWKETWASSRAQRHGRRLQQRQAASQQRLNRACWFLASWAMRLKRWSAPSVVTASAVTVQPLHTRPPACGSSSYSWRQPFLRRPPSGTPVTKEVPAKK